MYLDHVYSEIKSAASHTSSTMRERFYLSLILLARSCCVLLVAPSFADEITYHSYVIERCCQQRNHQTKRLTAACIQTRTYSVEVKCRRTMMTASSITSSVIFTSSLEAPRSYLDGILKNPSRCCAVFQRRAWRESLFYELGGGTTYIRSM